MKSCSKLIKAASPVANGGTGELGEPDAFSTGKSRDVMSAIRTAASVTSQIATG
jgi:hypothetical protein